MPSVRAGAVVLALLATLTLWSSYVPVPGRGRLDGVAPFTQLLALRPLLAVIVALAGIAGSVWTTRRCGGAVAPMFMTVTALLACVQIAPRAMSRADPAPRSAPRLTVLVANTLRSSVAPSVVVGLVRRTDADVIALPETNAELAASFARALTLDRGERWRSFGDPVSRPGEGSARPTSMVVRDALGPRLQPQPMPLPGAHGEVRVRLTRLGGGRGTPVAAVHPLPPAPVSAQRQWRRDLLALRSLCRDGWILAGDFNATIDHSPMRALKRAGCSDAAASTGQGLKATWTAGGLPFVRVPIDHVMTSGGWRATRAGVLRIEGSDHRAIWAELVRD
jgi:endonuclease/exonuclease/phosphatase (EEP) superfamily protein YafD